MRSSSPETRALAGLVTPRGAHPTLTPERRTNMQCAFVLQALASHRDQATLPPPRHKCERKSAFGFRTSRGGCAAANEPDSNPGAIRTWHAIFLHLNEDADEPGHHTALSMVQVAYSCGRTDPAGLLCNRKEPFPMRVPRLLDCSLPKSMWFLWNIFSKGTHMLQCLCGKSLKKNKNPSGKRAAGGTSAGVHANTHTHAHHTQTRTRCRTAIAHILGSK